MRALFTSIVITACLAASADAPETAVRTRTSLDHSAFFNGAGYQEDVPRRVGPTSRTVVHIHPNLCYPWYAPVNAYWVPGYYQTVAQRVWIQPAVVSEWVPPVYQYQIIQGRQVAVMVRQGYYQQVVVPGHYEDRPVQVWVEGRWAYW